MRRFERKKILKSTVVKCQMKSDPDFPTRGGCSMKSSNHQRFIFLKVTALMTLLTFVTSQSGWSYETIVTPNQAYQKQTSIGGEVNSKAISNDVQKSSEPTSLDFMMNLSPLSALTRSRVERTSGMSAFLGKAVTTLSFMEPSRCSYSDIDASI